MHLREKLDDPNVRLKNFKAFKQLLTKGYERDKKNKYTV